MMWAEIQLTNIQWGSEIRPLEGRISNGRAKAMAVVPTVLSQDFKWVDKMLPFVRISNGCWVSGFQIPFEILIICNPTSF